MKTENYNLDNSAENEEEKAEKLKLKEQKIKADLEKGKEIFGEDTKKTENIIDKNINNIKKIEKDAFKDFNVGNQFFDLHNLISEKIERLETNVKSSLKYLNNATVERYSLLVKREIGIEDGIKRLGELKEKKIKALESEKQALNKIKNDRGFFEKIGSNVGNAVKTVGKVGLGVGTLGGSIVAEKVYDKYWSEDGKSKRDIDKIEDLEERFSTKLETVRNEKSKIEDLINGKKEGRDEVEGYIGGIVEGIGLNNDEKNNLIQELKEGNIGIFGGKIILDPSIKDMQSYDKIDKILEKINDKNINKKTKKVLFDTVKLFNKKNINEFKEFDKIQRVVGNKDEYLKKIETEKEKENNLEYFEKNNIDEKVFSDIELEKKFLNGKEFGGNYEGKKIISKDGTEKFLFIEKGKDGGNLNWDESSVLIFDKEKGFVEVDEKFLEDIKDKKIKNEIEEKISKISYYYEDLMSELKKDIKNKEKIFKILESYEKFGKKFKNISKKTDEQKKYFEEYFKELEKKSNDKIKKQAKTDAKKFQSANNPDFKKENLSNSA